MGKVLCATRGGTASYRTQDAAIALVKERGDELVFVFVVDVCFLRRSRRAVRPEVVATEMAKMAQFLLQMARERAKAQGVDASVILRRGPLRDTLQQAVREQKADLLVLGRPAGEESAYALEGLRALADEIERETRIQVVIL